MSASGSYTEIPFDAINAAALARLSSLLHDWFPNGRRAGHEWCVGSIDGEAGESFKVNVQTGKWAEFNGRGETGGDVIGLYAVKFCRGDRVKAALDLAEKFGIDTKQRARPKPRTKPNEGEWISLIPPPADAGPPPDAMLSSFDTLHRYTSLNGCETHFVGRIEARGDKRKQFVPITYGELNGKRGWHKRAPSSPRPLYGLNKLTAMPDAPVILFEGEKAADAAQRLLPDHACMSWFGGTAQVKHADLSPLANREVIAWPDADAPGRKAMRKLMPRLPPNTQVVCTDGLPETFDAADLEHQGCDHPLAWLNERLESAHEFCNDEQSQASPGPSAQQHRAMLVLPPPSAPVAVARCFVESRCLYNGTVGALKVRYWCGSWWTWRTTHWIEAQLHTMRSLLYEFTADAVYLHPDEGVKPWSPTRNKISDLLEALSSLVILQDDFEQPCWIDGCQTGPIVATSNGLLDVASLQLYPHTPLYFGQVSVPFAYDKDAPPPTKWLNFVDELWPNEPDAVDVLGEWFGYIISGRLDLQKIFVTVGPTRSGKGVIARIETALIGKRNVCGPTLSSFGSQFGLMPLLGKSLAIISDARSGSGKNSVPSVSVERLLSISGEDTLTVDRKYKEPYTGKLPDRLQIISNELPRFGDASGAIIGRLVVLLTTRSWLGKEDFELENKLRTELPGILNWSLEGLRRLTFDNENHFTRFAAADEAIVQMQDLASPVRAFVRERCVLHAQAEIAVDDLWEAYKTWRETSEHPKMDKAHFGRDLRAACPSVRKQRPREKDKAKRHFMYAGIRLRKDEDELPL